MTQHLTILTGASRGLGLAIARQLLQPGHRLLTMSRQPAALTAPEGAVLEQWSADLAAPALVAARLAGWLRGIDPATLASATLINNAGVISQLAPLGDVEADDLSTALRVGLEAPTLLSAAFLRGSQGWRVPRKVLLVSSGLGRRAMAGSASYCAAKAGLDHLARAVALEEAARPNGARIVSLAPGIIDTDMQVQLRSADAINFPDQAGFAQFKAAGQLSSASEAAKRVLAWLARPDFGQQAVADVRDSA
jgi:NAD(P)-dependent dehydrogenase (short-subunit alcohol dehydrogenase family)